MTTYEVREFDRWGFARLAEDPPDGEDRDQALELQRRDITKTDTGRVSHRYDLTIYADSEDLTFYGMTDTEVQRLARSLIDLVGSVQPADVQEGEASPVLGTVYFAARRWADGLVPAYQTGAFAKIVKEAADHFLRELEEGAENYVLADVSSNVQGHVWHLVDRIVEDGIIGDTPWVVQRYGLGERYPCAELRKKLAEKCRDVLVPMVAQRLRDEADQALHSRDWYARQSHERREKLDQAGRQLGRATEMLVRAHTMLGHVARHSLLWGTGTADAAGWLRDEIGAWIEKERA